MSEVLSVRDLTAKARIPSETVKDEKNNTAETFKKPLPCSFIQFVR